MAFACSNKTFWTGDGIRVSHASCGGVTDGEWMIYAQGVTLPHSEAKSVKRTLQHVLNLVERPRSTKEMSLLDHIPFDTEERL